MKVSPEEPAALDAASPRQLWIWAWSIVLVGLIARLLWFDSYQDQLALLGSVFNGHFWSLGMPPLDETDFYNPFEAVRAFAPGYGAFIRGVIELSGQFGDPVKAFDWILAIVQSLMVAAATLITFALSRRVLFGYWALVPAALMTASVALLELPGGFAEYVPLMLTLVLAVWILTLLRERAGAADLRGAQLSGTGALLLTLAAGLTLGICILFSPACLLLAPLIIWWSFRGLGRDHAILLLVGVLLLPACWLAVIQSETSAGVPIEQIDRWAGQDGQLADSLNLAADRAYAVLTPWNPRFSRGAWASANWNYEWVLPLSLRADTNYISATRVLGGVWIALYLALVLGGVLVLMLEGAGSAARLLALPVLSLPLATFLTPAGGLLRVAILPFLMIALCLGAEWLLSFRGSGRRPEVGTAENR